MNDLPLYLLDDILFRLELKSLAIMRCTNKYFQSHISDDSSFETIYLSRFKPSLFHLCSHGTTIIFCQPLVSSNDSISIEKQVNLNFTKRCYIFGSCSGLVLLYINGLFVSNPLTKTFRILDHSGSKLIPTIVGGRGFVSLNLRHPDNNFVRTERAMCVGFAVNKTTKRFKIVCILEMETVYGFEISDGYSWRLSETTINASSKSDLTMRMKHVYLDGTLYWLRNDGSLIAFNTETEQAQLIPSIFHRELDMKLLFAADDQINCLTLISGTKEIISVYTLVENSKWTLAKQIKNVSMEDDRVRWNIVAYDGRRLLVWETMIYAFKGLFHVYDMETNSWKVLESICRETNIVRDYYKFTPSLFSVKEDEQTKVIVASNDERIPWESLIQVQPSKLSHALFILGHVLIYRSVSFTFAF